LATRVANSPIEEVAVPTSTRFAVAIHLLTNLALRGGQPSRSQDLARSVKTNSAVVRRILGSLANAGLVQSRLGQGGGALLAKPADQITLRDIYRAVEEPHYFAYHRSAPAQGCYVGHNITPVLQSEFQRLEDAANEALAQTTMADIAAKVETQAGFAFTGDMKLPDAKPKSPGA
jgi:Rrf2 family protein